MDHGTRLFIAYDFGVNRCTVSGFNILMVICKQTARHNISKLTRCFIRSRNADCISQSSGSICLNSCCAASIWAVFKKPCWLMMKWDCTTQIREYHNPWESLSTSSFFMGEKRSELIQPWFLNVEIPIVDTEVPCFVTINLYFWCFSSCVIMDGFLPRPAP